MTGGSRSGALEEAANLLRMEWERRFDRLVDHHDLGDLGVMDELTPVLDGRAPAEQQVLATIWRGHNRDDTQQGWVEAHACFLQHLGRARLLPRLPQHLVAAGKRELALSLTRQRATDHQQAAIDRNEDDYDGGGVLRVWPCALA